jgi:hypothetical protein
MAHKEGKSMSATMDITPKLSGLVGWLRSLARDDEELAASMALEAWPKLNRTKAEVLVAGDAELVELIADTVELERCQVCEQERNTARGEYVEIWHGDARDPACPSSEHFRCAACTAAGLEVELVDDGFDDGDAAYDAAKDEGLI